MKKTTYILGENICKTFVDKRLVSGIDKQTLKLNNKINDPTTNGQTSE